MDGVVIGPGDRGDDAEGIGGNALEGLLGGAIETQWRRASKAVATRRRRCPQATADQIAERLIGEFVKDITVIGAAGGAIGASPAGGQALMRAGASTATIGILLDRASYMILGVADAYGYELSDIEARRSAVLGVLATWAGVSGGATGIAGSMGAGLGTQATKAVPMPAIHAINRRLNKQIVFKWSDRTGSIRLGTVLPMGIGALLGGTTNYVTARSLAAVATNEFRPPHP